MSELVQLLGTRGRVGVVWWCARGPPCRRHPFASHLLAGASCGTATAAEPTAALRTCACTHLAHTVTHTHTHTHTVTHTSTHAGASRGTTTIVELTAALGGGITREMVLAQLRQMSDFVLLDERTGVVRPRRAAPAAPAAAPVEAA